MNTVRCVAVASLIWLTGCGEASQSTTMPAGASTPAATASPSSSPAAAAVKIEGFEFQPRVVRVAKGTRVTWTDADAANHNVTFAKVPGDLGNIREGGTRAATFSRAGRFSYVCQYHPNMRGTVIVK